MTSPGTSSTSPAVGPATARLASIRSRAAVPVVEQSRSAREQRASGVPVPSGKRTLARALEMPGGARGELLALLRAQFRAQPSRALEVEGDDLVGRTRVLQDASEPLVQIGAPELRRRVVDTVAKERVREAIRARDARKDMRERRRNELRRPVRSSFDDEVAMRKQRERRRRGRGIRCKRLDSGVPELPAHHRAPLGDGALLGGEALDPSLEHRLEPRGQLLRVSPFRHVTRKLEEHQRVPFRIAHEPPAVRADNVAGQLLEHELRRRRVEGLERDAHVLPGVGEVGPGVEHVGSRRREHGDSRHARQGDGGGRASPAPPSGRPRRRAEPLPPGRRHS